MVIVPGVEGELGFLPRHEPLVSLVAIGEARVQLPDGTWERFATGIGYVQVLFDKVLLVVDQAEQAGRIDVARAAAARKRAEERLALRGDPGAQAEVDFYKAEQALRTGREPAQGRGSGMTQARRPPSDRRRRPGPAVGEAGPPGCSLLVRGGRRLEGEIVLAGAKNSALKLMAASLLTEEPSTIRRVPRIADVFTMIDMLRALGADVTFDDGELRIDPSGPLNERAPYELVRRMRASIIVMGPMVARLGRATIAMPGGCNIGPRRIDFHIRGLQKLGAAIEIEHGFIEVTCDGLRGAVVPLDYPSVGATENLLMAATAARGTTVIDNAAREPEIVDLAKFLMSMGAQHPRRRHQLDRDRGRARAARRHPRGHRRPHRGRHLPAGRRRDRAAT